MQQAARLWFSAIVFAALCLPALAAERIGEEPIFYLTYNVGACTVKARGIGEVTATFGYYWDIEANQNVIAAIMNVKSDLVQGFSGSASKGRISVTVGIRGPLGVFVSGKTCEV